MLNWYLITVQTAHLVNTMLSISISLVYSQTIQHISVPQIFFCWGGASLGFLWSSVVVVWINLNPFYRT